jgi:hypothetical protein
MKPPIDILLEEAAHMARATVEQIDLGNQQAELCERRAAQGDTLVIDWLTGQALSIDEGNVIAFPQRRRK